MIYTFMACFLAVSLCCIQYVSVNALVLIITVALWIKVLIDLHSYSHLSPLLFGQYVMSLVLELTCSTTELRTPPKRARFSVR